MANLKIFWDPQPGVSSWQVKYKLHSDSSYTTTPTTTNNWYNLPNVKRCNPYDIEIVSTCVQSDSSVTHTTNGPYTVTADNGTCGNQHVRIFVGNVTDQATSDPTCHVTVHTSQLNPIVAWYNQSVTIPFSGNSTSSDYLITSLDDPLTGTVSITNNDTETIYYNISVKNNAGTILGGSTHIAGNMTFGQTVYLNDTSAFGTPNLAYTMGESLDDYNIVIYFSKTGPI